MEVFEELIEIAKRFERASALGDRRDVTLPLKAVQVAADEIKRSFCGSWLGYHSRVYYDRLMPPPPGAHFSQEWGLKDTSFSSFGSSGQWREYGFEQIKSIIQTKAGNPDLGPARKAAQDANALFNRAKSDAISILHDELDKKADIFLKDLKDQLEKIEPLSKGGVADRWSPKGQIVTRDMLALGQKLQVPPHLDVLAELGSIRHSFAICKMAAEICEKASAHLERKTRRRNATKSVSQDELGDLGFGLTKKEEWVTAAGALHLLRFTMGQATATIAICERANDGMIKTKAERFIRDKKVSDNVELPGEFWWARGEEALKQNWITGDFETWIGQTHYLRAYGVRFLKSDILKMIPKIEEASDLGSDADLVAPASDRVVRIDHNSRDYTQAIREIDELEHQLRGWNEYPDSEDKEQQLAELEASKSLLRSVRVRVEALFAIVFKALTYIAKKFTDHAIGAAAKGVLALIGKLTGLW